MKKNKKRPGPKLLSPYTPEMEKLIKDAYLQPPVENIAQLKEQYQNDGNPIISVDTKKKNS